MLSHADNVFLTHTGPGTPMGDLLRRFWMPALLSEELAGRIGAQVVQRVGRVALLFRPLPGDGDDE